jgi:hypothetical protein
MGFSCLLGLACALVSCLLPRGHLLWSSQNPFWLPFAQACYAGGNADRVCETERIARSCIGWQHLTVVRLRCAGGPGNLFNPTKAHSYSTVGLHLKPDALHSLSGRVHACVCLRVRACICSCVCVCLSVYARMTHAFIYAPKIKTDKETSSIYRSSPSRSPASKHVTKAKDRQTEQTDRPIES